VVAQEVKALAGQTAKATEEISTQIAGMQQATVRSVDAINGIQHTIREVGEITTAIAAAVSEQGAATREIARSAEVASNRTSASAADVGQVGQATDATRKDATIVKDAAGDVGTVAGRIRDQVAGFFERLKAA
jgi:methyl-accepting chemotaxis protein